MRYPAVSLPVIRAGAVRTLSVGSSSTVSEPITATVVRLVSTTGCRIAIGWSPVATSSSIYLPPDTVEYWAIEPGQRIAAIQEAAPGVLSITEAVE